MEKCETFEVELLKEAQTTPLLPLHQRDHTSFAITVRNHRNHRNCHAFKLCLHEAVATDHTSIGVRTKPLEPPEVSLPRESAGHSPPPGIISAAFAAVLLRQTAAAGPPSRRRRPS
ncbi:hypothetical protein F2Q69_00035288 [Brassica cretica]|uniref:Uncharacterized protein n=1 Tax=Brassica cretica TaxID=69181 RepID=A0A8S9SG73_BRACR|nr:hypothetical protein F2Q69_00035288 [Brassica cretica]